MLKYLRDPAVAAKLGIDTKRIALAGHSMGGWVTALTAAHDRELIGAILISAADMGYMGLAPRPQVVAEMADNMESLAGVTAETMADEVTANARTFEWDGAAAGLARTPLLVLTADDGLAPASEKLVKAIQADGGTRVTVIHQATDHSWSDHRIFLEITIINWLGALK